MMVYLNGPVGINRWSSCYHVWDMLWDWEMYGDFRICATGMAEVKSKSEFHNLFYLFLLINAHDRIYPSYIRVGTVSSKFHLT